MWCFHDRLKQFEFNNGEEIKCCDDCTAFDNKRIEVLRVGTVDIPKAPQQTHWRFLLEEAGLSESVGDVPWLRYMGTMQDLVTIPGVSSVPEYLDNQNWSTTIAPLLKRLYDQRRIDAAKRYTMLDDKEHVERAKPFLHTLTMPRALRNFCPRCSSYQTADHEGCEGNKVDQVIALREREQQRTLRNATLILSNPNELTPSRILQSKGGYGK